MTAQLAEQRDFVGPRQAEQESRQLIAACLTGDRQARGRFQELFGELIYRFPIHVYRTAPEEAGDFYVFAFENNRIFRRIRTFEGRTSLRAYLAGSVLDNLVLEWKRARREPIYAVMQELDEGTLRLPDRDDELVVVPVGLLRQLDDEKSVIVKLLYIEDYDLEGGEVRYLARFSGRRVRDVLARVERLRRTVRAREAGVHEREDALAAVYAWLRSYERRIRRIDEELEAIPAESTPSEQLRRERAELERKRDWRRRQQASLLAQARRRKVTAPYRDIAELLNTSLGNVAARIKRVRDELARSLAAEATDKE